MKKIAFGDHARTSILHGIKKLNDAVSSTLGPMGRNVVIERANRMPYATKDGVTVAVEFECQDEYENLGAMMVKQAAIKTAEEAGDGTTTSTILASKIMEEGNALIELGENPVQLKAGIEAAAKAAIELAGNMSVEVVSIDQLKSVATISANNDQKIGEIISEAFSKITKDGIVTVEESKTLETKVETVEGMRIERGVISPYFITEPEKLRTVLKDPYIILCDNKITQMQDLVPILDKIRATGRPVLIVCDDVESSAMSFLTVNHLKGHISVCVVRSPGFGSQKIDMLKDIATVTGGCIISQDTDKTFTNISIGELGTASQVICDISKTIIINGSGDKEAIENRINALRSSMELETNQNMKALTKARIASMSGGIAVIQVGASTELEMNEKKDRIDDAINATQAAREEGIVPGGGVCMLNIADSVKKMVPENQHKSFNLGVDLFAEALRCPIRSILRNAGCENIDEMLYAISKSTTDSKYAGVNAKTDVSKVVKDMMAEGIIDPTKVIKSAIRNAVSVSSIFLTTNCVIAREYKDPQPIKR